jgi:DNA-binding PadR family transcriptional regulator
VLTLLAERPRHVYEMRTVMRERGHDNVMKLTGGSIYDALERLEEAGLVKVVKTSRQGKRPERTVYAITPDGEDEVREWMREILSKPVKEYPEFAVGLAFVLILEKKDDVILLLENRAGAIEADLAAKETYTRRIAGSTGFELPRIVLLEGEYDRAMLRAELQWLRKTIRELREGTLEWPSHAKLERIAAQAEKRRGK